MVVSSSPSAIRILTDSNNRTAGTDVRAWQSIRSFQRARPPITETRSAFAPRKYHARHTHTCKRTAPTSSADDRANCRTVPGNANDVCYTRTINSLVPFVISIFDYGRRLLRPRTILITNRRTVLRGYAYGDSEHLIIYSPRDKHFEFFVAPCRGHVPP